MNHLRLCLTALFVSAFPATALAQVPSLLPVQGLLTDDQGQPLLGTTAVSFALYTQATGGTAFFEASRSLSLEDGTFAVYLGENESLDFAALPASGDVYIGLSVDGDVELSPRIQIGTVPFAARAEICNEAQTLQGASAGDFATTGHGHDYSELTNVPATFEPTAHQHAYAALSGVPATFAPAAHQHDYSQLTNVPTTFAPSAHQQPWSQLTNIPASIADGDDDALGSLNCAVGQVAELRAGGWRCRTLAVQAVQAVQNDDAYVRNTGDTIEGDLQVNGAVTATPRSRVATGSALTLSQNLEQAIVHVDRPNWFVHLLPSVVDDYCGDIDGCTIVLIERGYLPSPFPRQRRRASVPRTLMTDAATGLWSIDATTFGQVGAGRTRTVAFSVGACNFVSNQAGAGGVHYNFGVGNAGSSSTRTCTLVVRD